jgi:hypothetical protein
MAPPPRLSWKAMLSIPFSFFGCFVMCSAADMFGELPAAPLRVGGVAFESLNLIVATAVGLIGLMLAILALAEIRRDASRLWGRGVAFVGVVLSLLIVAEFGFIWWVIRGKTDGSLRIQSLHNVKMLANAMLDYQKAHGTLPPAAVNSPDGKGLLSWRVLVLPQLGYDSLYRQFKLDQPWDSPHNLALLENMPTCYTKPGAPPSHLTHYQVFVGPGAAFEGQVGLKLADFTDGTDQTLLVVEATQAVPWTKPQDLSYFPNQPLPKVGGLFGSGWNVAFADGRERVIPENVGEATLRALITRKGGDKPGNDY